MVRLHPGGSSRRQTQNEEAKMTFDRKIALAALAALLLATTAHAGDWPRIGDQVRLGNGTIVRGKLGPCHWTRVDALPGTWLTYGGVSQQ
jgi:hypothetical protein